MPLLLAALVMSAPMLQSSIVDRIAAIVDDVAIPESEVRKAMVVSGLTANPGETREAFRGRILDAMIDERLSYNEALRFGPTPPNAADVDAALTRLRERLQSEGKDPAKEFAAAGMTAEEVRASVERQLVIQRYLHERFRPIALADEERAREEYEKYYVPERQSAGQQAEPFEKVGEEMRRRSQQRIYDDEVEKWLKDLREKASIAILRMDTALPPGRTPTPLK